MSDKKSLEIATNKVESSVISVNNAINELGTHTYCLSAILETIQNQFDKIRGIPSDKQVTFNKLKEIRLGWKNEVDKIVQGYNVAINGAVGTGAAGTTLGIGVATLGPTAAMGVATTFGVASTGTAISTLSGAAATNAALAWLGGGALAAGGSGMAGGALLLNLAGPVGWALAGLAFIGSGILYWLSKSNQERLIRLFLLIAERDQKSYDLAAIEINERVTKIIEETRNLILAIAEIGTFGIDYQLMTEEQQYKLGTYFNLMESTTQLLVKPIMALAPKITESDLNNTLFKIDWETDHARHRACMSVDASCKKIKDIELYLASLLYSINVDKADFDLLIKSLKKDKNFLESFKIDDSAFYEGLYSVVTGIHNEVFLRQAASLE